MIIEISDDSSMVKWKMNDNEDWKSAEISDLIKAYESPKVTVFAENASKEEIEDFKQELENVLEEKPQGKWIIDGHHIRCNRCNEYICNTDREGNKIPDNFCPNCGARMQNGGAV